MGGLAGAAAGSVSPLSAFTAGANLTNTVAEFYLRPEELARRRKKAWKRAMRKSKADFARAILKKDTMALTELIERLPL